MAKITKGLLKKEYPLADIDYLLAMVEGKIYMSNYIFKKKNEVKAEFELVYLPMIENVFIDYMNKNERDFFITDDVKMVDIWRKKINTILMKYLRWVKKFYVVTVSESYNYKRLYYLWMLDAIYGAEEDEYEKPKVIGEADENKKGVIDPGFTKEKLNSLINKEVYGKTFDDKVSNTLEKALNSYDSSIANVLTGNGKNLNQYLKIIEKDMRKNVSNKMSNAVSIGIEDVEDIAEYDIFSANPRTGNYQRVEILDNKTCLVCADIDHAVYKEPIGRVHPNCRGIDVPIAENADKDAIRKMGTKKARKENFNNWFDGLNDIDKRRVLGKSKYEQYKNNKLDVHTLVKDSRVLGSKEIERIEQLKLTPNIKNDLNVARNVINAELKKVPNKSIANIKTTDELNAYSRYVNKKESIYRNLDSKALKKAGIYRNTLNAEINRERKLIRLKEKEIKVDKLTK